MFVTGILFLNAFYCFWHIEGLLSNTVTKHKAGIRHRKNSMNPPTMYINKLTFLKFLFKSTRLSRKIWSLTPRNSLPLSSSTRSVWKSSPSAEPKKGMQLFESSKSVEKLKEGKEGKAFSIKCIDLPKYTYWSTFWTYLCGVDAPVSTHWNKFNSFRNRQFSLNSDCFILCMKYILKLV